MYGRVFHCSAFVKYFSAWVLARFYFIIMPDVIKSLKKENDDLKLEVSSLKSDLKNLEASIERRITQSNVQHGDRSTRPDNKTKKSLEFLSNSYDDLSNFRKTAKIEFERLDKRLDSLEVKVDGITNAIDNLECYSYQYNAMN